MKKTNINQLVAWCSEGNVFAGREFLVFSIEKPSLLAH
jgi:hypothetical protein